MSSVHAVDHIPAMIRTLNDVVRDYNASAAHDLAGTVRETIPDDAPAAAAQRAGVYVRTATDSGYEQAVRAVRDLFASDLAGLFAASISALFASDLSGLFAEDLSALADPRIVPEVDEPPDTAAIVASATAWSQAEHWQAAIGQFDISAAYSGLIDEWLRRSGV